MGNLGDLSPGGSIAIGVIVGLISTSVQSLGLTLQRKSHILEDEKPSALTKRPPHRRRRWQLGMGIFIIANLVGSSIQITTLPLPVLSTLQASGLVFNSICATMILGEPFTRYSLLGTILVCAGAGLIAGFGAIKEPAHALDELLNLLVQRPFVIWMIFQAFLVAFIVAGARSLKSLRSGSTPRMRMARGIMYGCVSGILSAHSLLVAKSAVELLVRTIIDGKNQFNRWESWVILLSLVVIALSQLYFMHRGLKLCSTSVLYPLVFCIYNIMAICDGLIYFQELSQISLLHGLLIALGTVILLAGVFALSWRLTPEVVPVAQSALAPGMGFVEDTSTSSSSQSDSEDENSSTTSLTDSPKAKPAIPPSRRRSLPGPLPEGDLERAEIWNDLFESPSSANLNSKLPLISSSNGIKDLHQRGRSYTTFPTLRAPGALKRASLGAMALSSSLNPARRKQKKERKRPHRHRRQSLAEEALGIDDDVEAGQSEQVEDDDRIGPAGQDDPEPDERTPLRKGKGRAGEPSPKSGGLWSSVSRLWKD